MSTKPPIFIVSGKSPLSGFGGGYSTFARNLGKTLVSLGYPVYIVALGDTPARTKTDFGTLITVNASLLSFNVGVDILLAIVLGYPLIKGIQSLNKK